MCNQSAAPEANNDTAFEKDFNRYHQTLRPLPLPSSYPRYPSNPNRDWMRIYKGISPGDIEDGRVKDNQRHGAEAVQKLLDFLAIPAPYAPETKAAGWRLKVLARSEAKAWTPDIIFKAFDDIDETFFGGALLGQVCVAWQTAEQMDRWAGGKKLNGTTLPASAAVREESGEITCKHTIKILMNATRIFLDTPEMGDVHGVRVPLSPWATMWRTLIHEMIHCYLHVAKGFEFPDHCRGDADPTHGIYFNVLNGAVSARMERIFGFGLRPCHGKYTPPTTPEDKRLEKLWLEAFRTDMRERYQKRARTPEEWSEFASPWEPNIRVRK